MPPTRTARRARVASSSPIRSVRRPGARFAPSPSPPPPPAKPHVARWPICGPITDYGYLNWPDVRHLCYLTEKEVVKYEQDYWWMTIALEPILKIYPEYKTKSGFKWQEIFEAYDRRNWEWSNVTTVRSLSSMYDRHRGVLRRSIEAHNARVQGQSLEQRKAKTTEFLQLPREPVKDQPNQDWVPLVPCKFELYDPANPTAPTPAAAQSSQTPTSSKKITEAIEQDDDDKNSDSFEYGVEDRLEDYEEEESEDEEEESEDEEDEEDEELDEKNLEEKMNAIRRRLAQGN